MFNLITVKPAVSATGIKDAIAAALLRNAEVDGEHTTVTADAHGAVTLTGTVRTWAEHSQAARIAWSAPGATGVLNHLRVQN